jgi:hypothetical protein
MATHICKACGARASPIRRSPSNFGAELVVWIACLVAAATVHWTFVVGGIGFTLWRFTGRRRVCPKCSSGEVIPLDSPIGRQLSETVAPPVNGPRP